MNINKESINQHFFRAVHSGDLQQVQLLVVEQSNVDVNVPNAFNSSALEVAIWNNHSDIVDYLLATNKLSQQTINDALLRAVRKGKLELVKCLVEQHNADINTRDKCSNRTTLECAIERNDTTIIDYLLKTNKLTKECIDEGLMRAVCNGHLVATRCLLELEHYQVEEAVSTVLELAIQKNRVAIIEYLVGARKLTRESLQTVLFWAAGEDKLELVKYLVEQHQHQVDINLDRKCCKKSQAVIECAIKSNAGTTVAEYLLSTNKLTTQMINRALISAARYGKLKLVKCLVEQHQAHVTETINEAMEVAILNKHTAIAVYLLNVNQPTAKSINNACCKAVSGRNFEVMKLLIEQYHADINAGDEQGTWTLCEYDSEIVMYLLHTNKLTPEGVFNILLGAACNGDFKVVQYAVEEQHAEVNFRVVLSAMDSKHTEIIQYLVDTKKLSADDINKTFLWMLEQNKFELANYLVEQYDADVNATPGMELATKMDRIETVEFLLNTKKLSIESIAIVVNWAVRKRNLELLKCLVERHAADLNDARGREGESWCQVVARNIDNVDYTDVVKYLLNTNKLSEESINFVLHWAVMDDNLELVKCSVEQLHADVNEATVDAAIAIYNQSAIEYFVSTNKLGLKSIHRVLFWGIRHNYLELVNNLVEHNDGNVNASDENGCSTMELATEYNRIEIVKCLVNTKKLLKESIANAVNLAVCKRNLELLKCLVEEHAADLNGKDKKGKTWWEVVERSNNKRNYTDIFEYLLNTNKLTQDAINFVLIWAVKRRNLELVKRLVEQYQADTYRTAMDAAIIYRNTAIVEYLLNTNKLAMESINKALFWAGREGNLELVKCLVEQHQADVNARDEKENKTVLELAEQKYQLAIVMYIKTHANRKRKRRTFST